MDPLTSLFILAGAVEFLEKGHRKKGNRKRRRDTLEDDVDLAIWQGKQDWNNRKYKTKEAQFDAKNDSEINKRILRSKGLIGRKKR